MTFEQMRNAVVAELEAHIGRPVKLSEQISDIPDFPYCYYSVLAPRISERSFGLHEVVPTGEDFRFRRSEPVMATTGMTNFCL